MAKVQSFPPISSLSAERLILGSMPSEASLAAREYYAHPRNYFWHIMELVLGVPASTPYRERCLALTERGVAVWDVLAACTRTGSLDSAIVESSIVPNDFESFLRAHSGIRAIFFNGAKAEAVYTRHVLPGLPEDLAGIRAVRLPSTSPANASIPLPVKIEQWATVAARPCAG